MILSHSSTLTIAAGGIQPINAEGRNFWVIRSAVDLQIRTGGGEFALYGQGTGLDTLPESEMFRRLEIRNPSIGEITVEIYIGGPLYRDSRSSVMEPRTEFDGQAANSINAATGLTLPGVPSGSRIRRKSIQVTNLDPNSNLQIRDSAAHVGVTVFANTSITLPVSESVEIFNPNGAAVALSVSEIWWIV